MKILLVHNHYGTSAPSGENRVFELERDLLIRNGHEVETFERHSDDLRKRGKAGMIAGAAMTVWNPQTTHAMAEAVTRFHPDVVHAHNTFPMISPSVFSAAQKAARVLTLHNYRLACPAAIPLRNGATCTDCIDQVSILPALRYGCYRNSRAATLPLALNVAFHRWRGTWQDDVERFIALTDFQRTTLARTGLPKDRIAVKPNFYPGVPKRIAFSDRSEHVVFAGRLSEEKGVGDLVDAWLAWGIGAPELRILGDGPLRAELEARAAGHPCIAFLGQVSAEIADREIGRARLLLLPSRCFEGFPMVLREAFALGTPVGTSDQGPLPDIASKADGIVFRTNDAKDLLAKVKGRWSDPDRLQSMSDASTAVFETNYSETVNYQQLMEIYETAIQAAGERRNSMKISDGVNQ